MKQKEEIDHILFFKTVNFCLMNFKILKTVSDNKI